MGVSCKQFSGRSWNDQASAEAVVECGKRNDSDEKESFLELNEDKGERAF